MIVKKEITLETASRKALMKKLVPIIREHLGLQGKDIEISISPWNIRVTWKDEEVRSWGPKEGQA